MANVFKIAEVTALTERPGTDKIGIRKIPVVDDVCMVLFHDALLQIRMISEIQSFYLITEVRREASSIRRASLYRASCCIILSYADLS